MIRSDMASPYPNTPRRGGPILGVLAGAPPPSAPENPLMPITITDNIVPYAHDPATSPPTNVVTPSGNIVNLKWIQVVNQGAGFVFVAQGTPLGTVPPFSVCSYRLIGTPGAPVQLIGWDGGNSAAIGALGSVLVLWSSNEFRNDFAWSANVGSSITPPLGTIQRVQQKLSPTGNIADTNRSLAFTSNVTAGNTLILAVGCLNNTSVVTSVSDNLNGAWTPLVRTTANPNLGECSIWGFANSLGGACTVNVQVTPGTYYIWVQAEYAGLLSTIGVAGTGSAFGTTQTSQSSGNVTTTLPALLIGATFIDDHVLGTNTEFAGVGWTPIGNPGTIIDGLVMSQGEGTTGRPAGTYAATSTSSLAPVSWTTLFAAVR